MQLYFDTRGENRDAREPMGTVTGLMNADATTHAPPLLRLEWGSLSLKCVLESATEEIISLFPDGKPSRARLQVTFRESKSLAELQEEQNRE